LRGKKKRRKRINENGRDPFEEKEKMSKETFQSFLQK
jgi:hypothetical protein